MFRNSILIKSQLKIYFNDDKFNDFKSGEIIDVIFEFDNDLPLNLDYTLHKNIKHHYKSIIEINEIEIIKIEKDYILNYDPNELIISYKQLPIHIIIDDSI